MSSAMLHALLWPRQDAIFNVLAWAANSLAFVTCNLGSASSISAFAVNGFKPLFVTDVVIRTIIYIITRMLR